MILEFKLCVMETLPLGVNNSHQTSKGYFIQATYKLLKHGLKAQIVHLPFGVVRSIFITEMRQNDIGVQSISGLNNYLLELLHGIFIGGLFLAVYCDGIYAALATILPQFRNPTTDLHILNMRLAFLNECIENVLGGHHNRFGLFRLNNRLHLFDRGVHIYKMCLVSLFHSQSLLLP